MIEVLIALNVVELLLAGVTSNLTLSPEISVSKLANGVSPVLTSTRLKLYVFDPLWTTKKSTVS